MADSRTGSPADRPKQYGVLPPDAVREIFLQRPPRNDDGTFKPSSQTSHRLAAKHGVTERSIREIWNCKSWADITRPLWTDAEVAAVFANSVPGRGSTGMARQRRVGRPKGSKDAKKKARGSAASSSTSPADPPLPCPTIDFDFAKVDAGFGDPFVEDWECALKGIELGTMLWLSEFDAVALSQNCDESWLHASQDIDYIVSSRRSAMEEISRRDENIGVELNVSFGPSGPSLGHAVFNESWQGVARDAPWY
eukprot:2638874-Rhodomonas_salina.1